MRPLFAFACVVLVGACGGSDEAGAGGRSPDGSTSGSGGSGAGTRGSGSESSGGASGGGTSPGAGGAPSGNGGSTPGSGGTSTYVPTYGRFGGEPASSFTLPKPAATGAEPPALYFPTLATTFPDVDWATLDRLYIPAGDYKTLLLGELPERSADRPLVITNIDGQVKIGGHAASYVVSIRGGRNWILTGRYDPESRTGDAGFRGHAEGVFAHSQGTYGLFVDDAFSKEGLSGIAVGAGASDFEIELVEVARVEFAGIVAKTDDDGTATMRNVKLHDVYVHDTGSEGIYFGSTQAQPQHSFENLQIHDNRFIRTGTEALQVGQLGHGCEIHHNVIGPAAARWRSAFQRYQDGNVQYGQRYGSSSFHHNVVVGTGDLFVELFPTVVAGDPRTSEDTVTFSDNYFADTSSSGVYTHADDTGVTIRFERNVFRGFRFNYDEVYPDVNAPVQVFGVGAGTTNPHVLSDNRVDGPYPFLLWDSPVVTRSNNLAESVPAVRFVNFMGDAIDQDYRRLEWWTDVATLSASNPKPAVLYPAGVWVMHRGTLYEAIAENQGHAPDLHPDSWRALPEPADDARLAPGSPHAGVGLRWPPP